MLSHDEVRQTPKDDLSDPDKLLVIKQEILEVEDIDDRYLLLYALVTRLLEVNLWDKAEVFVRLMEGWTLERSWFLGDIATQMWRYGKREEANALFSEAVELSRRDGRAWQSAEALLRIANHYIEVNEKNMAIAILLESAEIAQRGQKESLTINNVQDAVDSSGVLREIAETLGALRETDKALQIAQNIIIESRRDAAINEIQKYAS